MSHLMVVLYDAVGRYISDRESESSAGSPLRFRYLLKFPSELHS